MEESDYAVDISHFLYFVKLIDLKTPTYQRPEYNYSTSFFMSLFPILFLCLCIGIFSRKMNVFYMVYQRIS